MWNWCKVQIKKKKFDLEQMIGFPQIEKKDNSSWLASTNHLTKAIKQ